MKKVSPARLPQQALDGSYSTEAGYWLPRAKPYLLGGDSAATTVHLCGDDGDPNGTRTKDSGPIVGEASRPIGPDIFSKGRNIMKKVSPARLPQQAFDGSYFIQSHKG